MPQSSASSINDVESKSPEILDDDHSKQVLVVLAPMPHGVRNELAHHQSGVVAPRSQRLLREGIIQRYPCKKGGFRRGRQDYLASQRDLLQARNGDTQPGHSYARNRTDTPQRVAL